MVSHHLCRLWVSSPGRVLLSDGRTTLGVLGEAYLVEGQREISSFGGWRAYAASELKTPAS